MKKIFIESLGCPKNLADSELILYHLPQNNYKIVDHYKKADTILINTCGFIEAAKEESIQTILSYKSLPDKEVIVTGCMVNLYKEQLKQNMPEIKHYYSIPEFFNKYLRLSYNKYLDYSGVNSLTPKSYSYIKISDGCSRHCSYCTIPLIKGKQFSRPIKNILNEIKEKAEKGFSEFNLIAQDMMNFGSENKESLSLLVKKISQLNLNIKARLLYLYPDKRLIGLAKQINDSEKMIKYLDIPVQHCSKNILKLMNRPDDSVLYKSLFDKIRTINPEFILRSTFIIGFPGETKSDFRELEGFIKDIKFNWAGFFAYSDEQKASSSKLPGKVNKKVQMNRLEKIISLQRDITSQWLRTRINKIYEVTIDEIIKDDNIVLARSGAEAPDIDGNIIIKYDKKMKVGNKLKVKIVNSFDYDLQGEIIQK